MAEVEAKESLYYIFLSTKINFKYFYFSIEIEKFVSETEKHSSIPKLTNKNLPSTTSSSSSDEDTGFQNGYSSSLLQQFVEKTEILSAQCERLLNAGRSRKIATQSSVMAENILERRAKRGRPPKVIKNSISIGAREASRSTASSGGRIQNKIMPELEAYRLDCLHSNVSPDSGIQSVPGSPINENINKSPNRDATPPVLRPISPVKGSVDKLYNKKRPGRPKKLKNEHKNILKHGKRAKEDIKEIRSEDRPSIHSLIPSRRGPGRPKKAPPILEPNIPVNRKNEFLKGETVNNLNKMLNEICERVNRRLELPSITKGNQSISLNEDIERIIIDHNTGKKKSCKFDALFSKSRKLPNVPNIAIVKPIQHHLINEKFENEKQNKRTGGRRRKYSQDESKWKDSEIESIKRIESNENDKIKSDDEKAKNSVQNKKVETSKKSRKLYSKIINPISNYLNCPAMSTFSSGTDESRDHSEVKKANIKKSGNGKKFKKEYSKVQSGKKVVTKPLLRSKNLSNSSFFPIHRKHTNFVCLKHGLLHHRHKKRKKLKRYTDKSDKKTVDKEWFLRELEKLIVEFQKCTIAVGKKTFNVSTGNGLSATQSVHSIHNETVFTPDLR